MKKVIGYIKYAAAIICAAISTLLGGWDLSLCVLVVFVALDYVTGLAAAYTEQKLSSRVGFVGITKKIMLFVPIVMAFYIDQITGQEVLRNLAIWFYAANEGLSVLENLSRIGVIVPGWLTTALEQLKNKGEKQ
jgi:toxin secretion/phage lysis holin